MSTLRMSVQRWRSVIMTQQTPKLLPQINNLQNTGSGFDGKSFAQLSSKTYTKSLEPSTYSAFSMATLGQPKPQTIFEVLQDICEKNDLRFGQAIASIFGNDLCLFYKTNEELLQIINEKKIKLNLK